MITSRIMADITLKLYLRIFAVLWVGVGWATLACSGGIDGFFAGDDGNSDWGITKVHFGLGESIGWAFAFNSASFGGDCWWGSWVTTRDSQGSGTGRTFTASEIGEGSNLPCSVDWCWWCFWFSWCCFFSWGSFSFCWCSFFGSRCLCYWFFVTYKKCERGEKLKLFIFPIPCLKAY